MAVGKMIGKKMHSFILSKCGHWQPCGTSDFEKLACWPF
jgi:hypothetical protein